MRTRTTTIATWIAFVTESVTNDATVEVADSTEVGAVEVEAIFEIKE